MSSSCLISDSLWSHHSPPSGACATFVSQSKCDTAVSTPSTTSSGDSARRSLAGRSVTTITVTSDNMSAIKEARQPQSFCRPAGDEVSRHSGKIAKPRRLVTKTGLLNVEKVNVSQRTRKYVTDMFTTMVDLPWIYQVAFFFAAFVVTWNVFGVIYYVIAIVHDDVNEHPENETWTLCIANVHDYVSAVLFSFETQTTIGYGFRYINSICHFGVFVVMLQNCVGSFVQTLATGLVFMKLTRPRARAQTLIFSRSAVICRRPASVGGPPQFQLVFRIGDMRSRSQMIGTSIRAVLIRSRKSADGQLVPFCQSPVALNTETSSVDDNFVFLVWPITVVHRICDETSPFWEISADRLRSDVDHFEIVVILEGTVESTGSSTQVRTSYLSTEILWGRRLAPLQTFQTSSGNYAIDYSSFHETLPVCSGDGQEMPDCSARHWTETQLQQQRSRDQAANHPSNSFGSNEINFEDLADFIASTGVRQKSGPGKLKDVFLRRHRNQQDRQQVKGSRRGMESETNDDITTTDRWASGRPGVNCTSYQNNHLLRQSRDNTTSMAVDVIETEVQTDDLWVRSRENQTGRNAAADISGNSVEVLAAARTTVAPYSSHGGKQLLTTSSPTSAATTTSIVVTADVNDSSADSCPSTYI